MDTSPSVIIAPIHNLEGEDIVQGILDSEELPVPTNVQDGKKTWLWEMENKYYTADVKIVNIQSINNHVEWILNNSEALIVYFNAMKDNSVEDLNTLLETLGEFEPEVQLLVCNACALEDSNTGLSRLKAQQWCISNGWELIELTKIEDEDSGQEDDFQESWGFQRIRQALHAHTWSNLQMKEKNSFSSVMQSMVSQDNRITNQSSDEILYSRLDNLTVSNCRNEENLTLSNGLQDHSSDELLEGMNSSAQNYMAKDEDDFEALFSNFEQMKKTAESLPPEHRRKYAEKVAISFWKAMGGSDDELEGLDSDD